MYVANMGAPNQLYYSLGNGGFEEVFDDPAVQERSDSWEVFSADLNLDGYREPLADSSSIDLSRRPNAC